MVRRAQADERDEPGGAARRTLALLAAALVIAGSASSGWALGIGDVDAKQFPLGGANTGFTNAGPGFDWALTPVDRRVCAGAGPFHAEGACLGLSSYELTVTQQLQTVHQNPQARGAVPSAADPFIADSLWTVTNTSGASFQGPLLLLFTSVGLEPYPGAIVPGGYPDLQTGLDGNLLDLVRYTATGTDFYFGAVNLGALGPGDSTSFLVRYIVSSGPMPIVSNNVVMPPLKIVGMVVPEPGTFALLCAGLAGLAAAGRRR